MVQNELTADSIKAATGKYDVESVFSLTVVNAGKGWRNPANKATRDFSDAL